MLQQRAPSEPYYSQHAATSHAGAPAVLSTYEKTKQGKNDLQDVLETSTKHQQSDREIEREFCRRCRLLPF